MQITHIVEDYKGTCTSTREYTHYDYDNYIWEAPSYSSFILSTAG